MVPYYWTVFNGSLVSVLLVDHGFLFVVFLVNYYMFWCLVAIPRLFCSDLCHFCCAYAWSLWIAWNYLVYAWWHFIVVAGNPCDASAQIFAFYFGVVLPSFAAPFDWVLDNLDYHASLAKWNEHLVISLLGSFTSCYLLLLELCYVRYFWVIILAIHVMREHWF